MKQKANKKLLRSSPFSFTKFIINLNTYIYHEGKSLSIIASCKDMRHIKYNYNKIKGIILSWNETLQSTTNLQSVNFKLQVSSEINIYFICDIKIKVTSYLPYLSLKKTIETNTKI